MKVLSISPPIRKQIYSKYLFSSPVLPPLGLLSIGTIIRKNKNQVLLVDCPTENKNCSQVMDMIKKEKLNIVCLTASTVTWNITKKIISQTKI